MELNQGQCDSPLTQTGITQAHHAKKWFETQDIHFDAVYSSTSERACDTAEIVSGGMPYIRRKGLKEIFLGTKEATPVSTNPEYPYGDFFIPFGGEGLDAFTERISQEIHQIAEKETGKTILIVSHGLAIKRFLTTLDMTDVFLKNCGIVHLTYENTVFTVEEIIDPVCKASRHLYQQHITEK